MRSSSPTEEMRDVGPFGQSVTLAFRFLFVGACVLALAWLFSNLRQIPPDSQAVVMRLGAVARVRGSGLLLALPRPIERVVVLPGRQRQISLPVSEFTGAVETDQATQGFEVGSNPRDNSGFLLTGDSSVVHFQSTLFYQITDPVAYMTAAEHVEPALRRLFVASAISIAASRDLDSILVARPELASRPSEAELREKLRDDLVGATNARIAALARAGFDLGVSVSRVDLVPTIPAGAKAAFDNVLVTVQEAQTRIAGAHTDAQVTAQDADQEKERIFAGATAAADERVSQAKVNTASVAALAQQTQGMSRNMQLSRLYYDRIGALLGKAGRVEVVDGSGVAHVFLPGKPQ